MRHQVSRLVATVGVLGVLSQALPAQQKGPPAPAATSQLIKVCALVSKEEVKKHLPWRDLLDQFPPEEEAIGTTGSSCNYPTVHVQVLTYTKSFMDAMQKTGPLEKISGVGDEAYFRNNKDRWAEIVVKVGARLLTLQGSPPNDGTVESVKPKVIDLAKVYVAKLR
jgi:hypothetical protein